MEVRRTVPITLAVDTADSALLRETVDEFLWAAQYVTDHAFEGQSVTTSKTRLNEDTYDEVRANTRLHSNHVQAARNKAADACTSVIELWKQGRKASKPQFSSPHVVYDHRSATFHDEWVSLATVEGQIEADYVLPDDPSGTPHEKYLCSDKYEVTGAELHHKHGEWQLHAHCKAVVASEKPDHAATENGTVLGVDLGVNQFVVTSTGKFWTGDELGHWRREYEKRRGDLQQCGTRWAHENIQSVGRKERGRFKQRLHHISKELVTEARSNGCSVIVFEDLADMRTNTNAFWGHTWAYNRLYQYVKYKAESRGITAEKVDPENTSRQCSHCGFIHPDNREGEAFECLKCEYQNQADYNAAKNIGLRYLRRTQTGDDGGAPVGVRLNSGTVNANGDISPAEESAGAGVHAECHGC